MKKLRLLSPTGGFYIFLSLVLYPDEVTLEMKFSRWTFLPFPPSSPFAIFPIWRWSGEGVGDIKKKKKKKKKRFSGYRCRTKCAFSLMASSRLKR